MSLASQWAGVKNALKSDNSESPGARFGLMFDPTAYLLDAVGYGDKYRKAVTGSGDWANERLSGMLGARGGNGWVANKPASTIGLLAAGYFGGGAALSGMGGGGAAGGAGGAGSAGQGLGVFSNGGVGGLSGVGGGNAGALAASHGISGGAGLGSASTAGGGFMGSMKDPRSWMQMAQQMPQGQQQQQQQPRPLQPVMIRGRVFWI